MKGQKGGGREGIEGQERKKCNDNNNNNNNHDRKERKKLILRMFSKSILEICYSACVELALLLVTIILSY